ncbi:MAG: hypothetical protein R3Y59_01865 [bacterium]
MKKYVSIALLVLFVTPLWSSNQYGNNSDSYFEDLVKEYRVAIKANPFVGYILPVSVFSDKGTNLSLGAQLSAEILPTNGSGWSGQWNFPTIGVTLLATDISASDQGELGQLFALYPYLSWKLGGGKIGYYSSYEFNARFGFGMAFFNKLSYASGSYVSGIVSGGLSAQVNYGSGYSWFVEFGANSINNAEVLLPSPTMNILNGAVGLRYHINNERYRTPIKRRARSVGHTRLFNISLTGGYRDVYFVDDSRALLTTLSLNHLWQLDNIYSTGFGADLFYNGGFVQQGTDGSVSYKEYISRSDYFIEENNIANKFRIGLSWNNMLTMGNVLDIILDYGIYLYDPIKNAYSYDVTQGVVNSSPFYSFNPSDEDGWMYFRAGVRVQLAKNLYVQVTGKTHLYRFEHIAFGLSYAIPQGNRGYHRR